MGLKIRAIKLRDHVFSNWQAEVENHWEYQDFVSNPLWRDGWISMCCAVYRAIDNRVYIGISSFGKDTFYAYDRKSDSFIDLGFDRIANKYDAKFHRSLELGSDGCLYAAIALLHDVDRYLDAPGGAIVKYDPFSGNITKLCVPIPHSYIQSICLDNVNKTVYSLHFAPEQLSAFDLTTGTVRDYGLIGTGYSGIVMPENIVLDKNGCVWASWSLTRAWQSSSGPDSRRLCKIDTKHQKITHFKTGLPMPNGSCGYAKIESFMNLGDGFIYASGPNGSLYRIDTDTAESQYLFTPIKDRPSRLASLVVGTDGFAYGVTGREGKCELLRFDFKKTKYELLGPIVATDGTACFQAHDICVTSDGTFYVCENDNPGRSGYLWEIKIN